ncbi:XRE family transcriptional regulator [Paucilactobacillus oligofermentans DSM 15707 = LMG 22743]|uniref:XRE family transcriptional regulator n=1 Tax=Paucilactobacillus oligofermentans DSM 15707 = LMG 22743 TaxID=1423778 RepID=A0A0R1RLZ1_9LACO|nr:helix-turn-helix transcriptional regulator [Paucilactobacillus oligofermentans]KRL55141.1 XRE family transcriptional regulator [Paucilactobacillus oligofermentans DSM 15707 = LMG 22743]CUS25871.1 Helix-turn-helix XRE-family transcriptional regulator [Paucilactobacillus oligofermentans DSM 15707 = LMG 22743]
MDISIFVNRRKELKISQVKLCDGICTQATLSKFENNSRVPSLSILSKLCVRMGMTVDDMYQEDSCSDAKIAEKLNETEKELMVENYQEVLRKLELIDQSQINSLPAKMQFCYLHGCVNALINKQTDEILFDFSRILNDLDEHHQTIYTQLAFLGSGIMYARHRELKQAAFYFDKVAEYIRSNQTDNQVQEDNYFLRILTLIFYTAEFFSEMENFKISNQLIKLGVKICSDNRVTYYLPRLKFLSTQNALKQHKHPELIQQLIEETQVFARINQNDVVVVKLAALKIRFQRSLKTKEL